MRHLMECDDKTLESLLYQVDRELFQAQLRNYTKIMSDNNTDQVQFLRAIKDISADHESFD